MTNLFSRPYKASDGHVPHCRILEAAIDRHADMLKCRHRAPLTRRSYSLPVRWQGNVFVEENKKERQRKYLPWQELRSRNAQCNQRAQRIIVLNQGRKNGVVTMAVKALTKERDFPIVIETWVSLFSWSYSSCLSKLIISHFLLGWAMLLLPDLTELLVFIFYSFSQPSQEYQKNRGVARAPAIKEKGPIRLADYHRHETPLLSGGYSPLLLLLLLSIVYD